jgi:predicted metal-dependent phosphoesterase TrpH
MGPLSISLTPASARRPATSRTGWLELAHERGELGRADLHIHTQHSDGTASVPKLMDFVRDRTDLSVIAITDHNKISGGLEAKRREHLYPFEVVVGEEVETSEGHVLGLFLQERIRPAKPAQWTVDAIREQGGLAVLAHPFSPEPLSRGGICDGLTALASGVIFDAIEVYNSTPLLVRANVLARRYAIATGDAAMVGGSDAHALRAVAQAYTLFEGKTAADLYRALLKHHTCAMHRPWQLGKGLAYAASYPNMRRHRWRNKRAAKAEAANALKADSA